MSGIKDDLISRLVAAKSSNVSVSQSSSAKRKAALSPDDAREKSAPTVNVNVQLNYTVKDEAVPHIKSPLLLLQEKVNRVCPLALLPVNS